MMEVYVQVLGPVEAAPGSYDWITAGVISNPESLDIDYLKSETVSRTRKTGRRPAMDVVRFVVMKDGIAQMKIMIDDFFAKEVF
jgi:hypothetical protein